MSRTWSFLFCVVISLSAMACSGASPLGDDGLTDVVGSDVAAEDGANCTPDCANRECGDDGCGGNCGACPVAAPTCTDAGLCAATCSPVCAGKLCGDDGCGGNCGDCPDDAPVCSPDGSCGLSCVSDCANKTCGADGCGGDCGVCGDSEVCEDGQCGAVCAPDCEGKECGGDGCGSDCGACPQSAPICSDSQLCTPPCEPACDGKECGDDGCGGVCGTCPEAAPVCDDNALCVPLCEPDCDGKVCGDDGCGGDCGACPDDTPFCSPAGACVVACTPDCDGKTCGDDGCGGDCGVCDANEVCEDGACAPPCLPDCGGKECGGDGCGGLCGMCPASAPICDDTQVCTLPCQPTCEGKECGGDGCGGLCGTCPAAAPNCNAEGACETVCTAACDGKECGDDGCGGTCGSCGAANEVCDANHQCVVPCLPSCDDKECGDDGCGNVCGVCPALAPVCGDDQLCQLPCLPECDGKECGDDGCGGVCGTCPNAAPTCGDNQQCHVACSPSCDGVTCGSDGCGGDCGACSEGEVCEGGVCALPCAPDCSGKECGDDGCGGLCGTCPASVPVCAPDQTCQAGCTPACEGKECGDDGCGEACGSCPAAAPICGDDGTCHIDCTPDCADKACGGDGCGGSCGVCDEGTPVCDGSGTCVTSCAPDCDGKECGDDGCGGACGTCPAAAPNCGGDGLCASLCVPACDDKECGDDGCGGVCGTCPAAAPTCGDLGVCHLACTPSCEGKACGDDGCGEPCGLCADDEVCTEGQCIVLCIADCDGKECGDDGCGGACGSCPDAASYCDAAGLCTSDCVADCDGKNCGDDGCGGTCGACEDGTSCVGDQCVIDCDLSAHACDGVCVDNGSTTQCGLDCITCPEVEFGEAECLYGLCTAACDPGFAPCPLCDTATCVPCGGIDEPCCDGECEEGTACHAGVCSCGDVLDPCCPGDVCDGQMLCSDDGLCHPGALGDPCDGEGCDEGLTCAGEGCACYVGCDGNGVVTAAGEIWMSHGDQPLSYANGELFRDAIDMAWSYGGCAIRSDGTVWCWDHSNTHGQLGTGTLEEPLSETIVYQVVDVTGAPLEGAHQVAYQNERACAVKTDGTLWCWGNAEEAWTPVPGCTDCSPHAVQQYIGDAVEPITDAEMVVVLKETLFYLDTDGNVWGWGKNVHDLLDVASDTSPGLFESLAGQIAKISGRNNTICALSNEGTVYCWGQVTEKIAIGGETPTLVVFDNTEDPLTAVMDLHVDLRRACALRTDRTLWCWGDANGGSSSQLHKAKAWHVGEQLSADIWQFGLANTEGQQLCGTETTGEFVHSAKTLDPTLHCTVCTPACDGMACGPDGCGGSCGTCQGATPQCVNGACRPDPCLPECGGLSCGEDGCGGSCGDCDATAPCIAGSCAPIPCVQQMHHGAHCHADGTSYVDTNQAMTADGAPLTGLVQVERSDRLLCGRHEDGTAWCWSTVHNSSGINWNYGQRGDGTFGTPGTAYTAWQVIHSDGSPLVDVSDIGVYEETVCAVSSDQLYCWGHNFGLLFQSALGCDDCNPHPVLVLSGVDQAPLSDVRDVTVEDASICLITHAGNLFCWGTNTTGERGLGDLLDRSFPTRMPALDGRAKAVASNRCALTTDGQVYCWGNNSYGTLGQGMATGVLFGYLPVAVRTQHHGGPLRDILQLSVSGDRACALRADHRVLCWGKTPDSNKNGAPTVVVDDGYPVDDVWRISDTAEPMQFIMFDGTVVEQDGDDDVSVVSVSGCTP